MNFLTLSILNQLHSWSILISSTSTDWRNNIPYLRLFSQISCWSSTIWSIRSVCLYSTRFRMFSMVGRSVGSKVSMRGSVGESATNGTLGVIAGWNGERSSRRRFSRGPRGPAGSGSSAGTESASRALAGEINAFLDRSSVLTNVNERYIHT